MRSQFNSALLPKLTLERNVIGPVQIVSESGDSVFVLPLNADNTESLLRLRRDQIDVVIYQARH